MQNLPETGLRSHRHHQQHDPGAPGQLERHDTPDPVRSNAVNVRFQRVRPQTNRHDQLKLSGIGARPQRTPLAELSPLSETGASCACANAGGDARRQDGRQGGTPEQNSPVIHEALHFDVVIAENMTRLVKLSVKLTAGHSAGIRRLRAGRKDRSAPRYGYAAVTDGVSRAKQQSSQSIRHLLTIAPFQLGVWKSTGPDSWPLVSRIQT